MKFRISRPIKDLFGQWEQPTLVWTLSVLWVIAIGWIAFGWNLGNIGLVDETEPLFAEAARQMWMTGDWITPYFNQVTRFDKPPLIYWLMAIAYQIIGVNEWAVRLPSALSAIGLMGLGFYTLRCFGFPSPVAANGVTETIQPSSHTSSHTEHQLWLSAWIGAALIALNPQTIAWGRTGVSDMLLSSYVGTALLAFFCGYTQPSRSKTQASWYLAFYLLSALAVLAKGPVGIVLPVLIIGAFLLYLGNGWAVLREMQLLWGSLIFLLLTLPWYILMVRIHGQDYVDAFFGYHNFDRFTSVVNNHAAPWYFYFPVVLVGFIPWSIFLPPAIARLRFWQRARWQQQPRTAHLGLFALIWFAVIFGFFTIAVTKLPSYVLPLMPAAAILVGLMWSDQMTRSRLDRGVQISSIVSVVFALVLAGVVLYSANWMGDDPAMPDMPQVIRRSGVLVWGGAIWVMTAIVATILLLRRQGRWIWSVHLVGFAAFVIFWIIPVSTLMDAERQLPLRQLAETIVQVQQRQEELIMVGFQKPSLVFYTGRSVTYLSDPTTVPERLRRVANRHPDLASALIVGNPDKLEETGLQLSQYQTLDQAGAYQLIRVGLPLASGRDSRLEARG